MKALIVTRAVQPEGSSTIDVMSAMAFLKGIGIAFSRSLVETLPSAATINSTYDFIVMPSFKDGFKDMINDAGITIPMLGTNCSASSANGIGNTPGVSARGSELYKFFTASWTSIPWAATQARMYTLSTGTALITVGPTDMLTGSAQAEAGQVFAWSTGRAGGSKLYASGVGMAVANTLPLLLQAAIDDGLVGKELNKVPWVCDLDHPNGFAAHDDFECIDTFVRLLRRASNNPICWSGFQNDNDDRFLNMSQTVIDGLAAYQGAPFKFCYHEHDDNGAFQPTTGLFPNLVEGANGMTASAQKARYESQVAIWEGKTATNGTALTVHSPAWYNEGANSFDSNTPVVFGENFGFVAFRTVMNSPNPAGERGDLRYNHRAVQTLRAGVQMIPTHSSAFSQNGDPFDTILKWKNSYQQDMDVFAYGAATYYHDQDFVAATQEPGVQRHGVAKLTFQGDLLNYLSDIAVPFADPTDWITDRRRVKS